MSSTKPTKPKFLDTLADENGVAVVVLDQEGNEVSKSNNNSICGVLYRSESAGAQCAEFCGRAFERTYLEGRSVGYECHAGLVCNAVPVEDRGKRFVAIVGRTYVNSARYREATEKAISGEWREFRPTEFFENVLFTGSVEPIETASKGLSKFAPKNEDNILDLGSKVPSPPFSAKADPVKQAPAVAEEVPQANAISKLIEKFSQGVEITPPARGISAARSRQRQDVSEGSSIRSLLGSLMQLDYPRACSAVLVHLAGDERLASAVWLERRNGKFVGIASTGDLKGKQVKVNIGEDHKRMLAQATRELPIELKARRSSIPDQRSLLLFPVIVGNEIRAAIGIQTDGHMTVDPHTVARFARAVGPQIEILRLRHIVSDRDWLARGVRKMNESLRRVDSGDFWARVTEASAELLRAERASILVPDEETDTLSAKAFVGVPEDLGRVKNLGGRIARSTLESGRPTVAGDIRDLGMEEAPAERRYKTGSFISFPISMGERKLAVLNFTDRVGGAAFGQEDVDLLQTIAPQIAVALDRKALKLWAGELEKRSITDSLTGLLNRGYLEKRLVEEMNSANRHRYPTCLLMIDVDNFKQYNDTYGHPAGDEALMIVAGVLRETLRAADVAARYGGEEFAILLPQTGAEEAKAIAERLRQRIERTDFPKRRMTISIGVAAYTAEFVEPKDWVTAADMALYEAKELGKNNVQNYEDLGRSFKEKIH